MEFVSISKLSRFKDKIMGLLNQKAPLQSPSFTGSPTTPTPTQSTTGKVLVNQEYVANSVSGYLPLTGGVIEAALGSTPEGNTSLTIQHGNASINLTASTNLDVADDGNGNAIYTNNATLSVGCSDEDSNSSVIMGTDNDNSFIALGGGSGSMIYLSDSSNSIMDLYIVAQNGIRQIVNLTEPTEDTNATNKKYVDDADAVVKEVADSAKAIAEVALPKTGGTMTGSLVLSGKPTADNGAANKKYVDDEVAKCAPMYGYGTADLNAGVSALETGKLYFVYE